MRNPITKTRSIRSFLACAALVSIASWGCNSPTDKLDTETPASPEAKPPINLIPAPGAPEYLKDSILVKFRASPSATAVKSAMAQIKGTFEDKNKDGIYDRFSHIANGQLALVQLDKSMTVEEAVAALNKDPAVEYAEVNWVQHITAAPNDARYAELYGMHNTGQTGGTADADIDAEEAWDNTVGDSTVVIGVVDTGVNYLHEDLAANMWRNPNEIPDNGIDDDGNGYVDDVHGINAINGSGDPLDDHAHGSHCAGTIGAVGNNGVGVAGVNWETSIMGLKFLSASGSGSTADAIEAIDYAVAQAQAGINIRVLSNSWGGGGFSQALEDSISAANGAGILFVAAAGNSSSNNDSSPHYPSSYEVANVVAVAATDHNDNLASFSSFGATSVDLGAPGVDTLSTVLGQGYDFFSGTSMATPHVAGAAALVLSSNQTLLVDELKDILMTTGDPIPALDGITLTGTRLNAANAVDAAGPPTPRFNMSASPVSQVIVQEDSTSYTIDTTSIAGFTGDVTLSVTSEPAYAGGTMTFSANPIATPGSSTLNVTSSQDTEPGVYSLTITGTNADGSITKERSVSLRVRPFGTEVFDFPSTDTPISIPDNDSTGITSTINVAQPITIDEVEVDVNITHTFIGDLIITLTSPAGTVATLHDRSGGGTDNLNETFSLPTEFLGEQSAGDWVLAVSDNAGIDVGTLDSWTLRIIGVPGTATFGISAAPDSQEVTQGDTASYDVTVDSFGGFSDSVTLSATADPAMEGTITFDTNPVAAPGTSVMHVETSLATAAGFYDITVIGDDGNEQKTATVSIRVRPFGSTTIVYPSPDTPIDIPDADPEGITSVINVPDELIIDEVSVTVDITHTFIGDLIVELTSPAGTTVTLHNRTGGSQDDLNETYDPTEFLGENSAGDWTLFVSDNAGLDTGTLNEWILSITGAPLNSPPVADFTYSGNGLSFDFTDASTDLENGIVSWAWDFGDGSSSADQHPSHSYAAAGDYTVCLTVTDDGGLSDTACQDVTASRDAPLLWIQSVFRRPELFEFSVELRWTGAETDFVDLYRNDDLADIVVNTGRHFDTFRRYDTSFTWYICEAPQSSFCSNTVSIVFGASESDDEVKVITTINGIETVETMKIIDIE